MAKSSIVFNVTACPETGGYVARWDDKPGHGGITTQGETLSELEEMIADAVTGYFEATKRPQKVSCISWTIPILALYSIAPVKIPRDLSGRDVVKALRRLGFEFSRQTGSHAIYGKVRALSSFRSISRSSRVL